MSEIEDAFESRLFCICHGSFNITDLSMVVELRKITPDRQSE